MPSLAFTVLPQAKHTTDLRGLAATPSVSIKIAAERRCQ
jgi:hypothetical protein